MNFVDIQWTRRQFAGLTTAAAGLLALGGCDEDSSPQTISGRGGQPVYALPDLTWDYGALQPYISGEINELHHAKHHAAYVEGANAALEQLHDARTKDDFAAIMLLEKDLAFNLGGHVNHSIWWKNLSPDGGGKPEGPVAAAIDHDFGSFDQFRDQFAAAANAVQGSGWVWLSYDTLGHKLFTFQMYDQQSNVPLGTLPLLGLDVFEHAYYLQYRSMRTDYIAAFWNVVNWPDVQSRFESAVSQSAGLIFP
ncbi:superoxide dismutase [Mycolicibacterium fortuitum]|nr:superoxide dismutase [Mycolicibacterium fortuitum]